MFIQSSKRNKRKNNCYPIKQDSMTSPLTRNKELKGNVGYFTAEKIEFSLNHRKK
jgi:hypothetical protein